MQSNKNQMKGTIENDRQATMKKSVPIPCIKPLQTMISPDRTASMEHSVVVAIHLSPMSLRNTSFSCSWCPRFLGALDLHSLFHNFARHIDKGSKGITWNQEWNIYVVSRKQHRKLSWDIEHSNRTYTSKVSWLTKGNAKKSLLVQI